MKELFPNHKHLHRWLEMAEERISFQGLPARICWIGLGERHLAGLAFNEMVRNGELKGPIVIGRDHLDSGSVASPNRETEAMMDGSDAVSDWPLLNALLNTASGATWSACTTAVVWAWVIHNTQVWSLFVMVLMQPMKSCLGFFSTTLPQALCGMQMQVMTWPKNPPS